MQQRVLVVIALAGWMSASFFAGLYIAGRPAPAISNQRSGLPPTDADRHRVVHVASTGNDQPMLSLTGVDSLEKLVEQITAAYKRPVHAHWNTISHGRGALIRFDLPKADLETAIRIINGDIGPYDRVDYRVYPDHLELGSPEYFDRQEAMAISYDVGDLIRAMQAAAPAGSAPTTAENMRQIVDAIQTTVEPDLWMDNGGDLARITVMGSGLLISCPKRLHPQVEWVLAQMKQTPGWNTGIAKLLSTGAAAVTTTGKNPTGTPSTNPSSTKPAAPSDQGP